MKNLSTAVVQQSSWRRTILLLRWISMAWEFRYRLLVFTNQRFTLCLKRQLIEKLQRWLLPLLEILLCSLFMAFTARKNVFLQDFILFLIIFFLVRSVQWNCINPFLMKGIFSVWCWVISLSCFSLQLFSYFFFFVLFFFSGKNIWDKC